GAELAGVLLEVVCDDVGLDPARDRLGAGGEEEGRADLEGRDRGLDVGEGRAAADRLDGLGHLLRGLGLVRDDDEVLDALGDQGVELVELGRLVGAGIQELELYARLVGENLEIGRVVGYELLIQVADEGADYRLRSREDSGGQYGEDEGDNDEFLHGRSPLTETICLVRG